MDTVFALWIIANSGQAKEYRAEGGEESVASRRGPCKTDHTASTYWD